MRLLRWAGFIWIGILLLVVLLAGALLAIRWMLPLSSSMTPAVRATSPVSGVADVPVRTVMSLRFSTPMNPRSVERAIQISPETSLVFQWNDDNTTLTISPTIPLAANTDYTLTLTERAQSQTFRTLGIAEQIRFHTAQAPTVLGVLPADGSTDLPLNQALSIRFSRPIVTEDQLGQQLPLPQLSFTPALEGTITWVTPTTALFQPSAPLQPGTRYQATLAPGVSDTAGGQLGEAFSWSFSTPAPTIDILQPPASATAIPVNEPLVARLSQPFDPAQLSAALVISPTVTGVLSTSLLPDATQLITFTPTGGWQSNTAYHAAFNSDLLPQNGDLPLVSHDGWSFQTAPLPRILGRFPGEGQALPPGQDIRLIFNTPIEATALQSALKIEPATSDIQVSTTGVEARISAPLQAATTYTMTIPADFVDQSGLAIGQEYRFRFVTAPAEPALSLPEATGRILQVAPQTAAIAVQRINISSLIVDLYQLDEATLVRTIEFTDDEWQHFSPERYGLNPLHNETVTLDDPLNQSRETRLALLRQDDQPLSNGSYYLRLRTPEGLSTSTLVFVTASHLILQQNQTALLLWSLDTQGAPINEQAVALYQNGALLQRGTTDSQGRWQVAPLSGNPAQPYIVVADGGTAGALNSAWGAATITTERYRAFLTTDSAAYRSGDVISFAGIIRVTNGEQNSLPLPGLSATISARRVGSSERLFQQGLTIDATGIISGSFILPTETPAGTYVATLGIGSESFQTSFEVQDAADPSLQIAIQGSERVLAGEPAQLLVTLTGPGQAPLSNVALNWNVTVARASAPQLDGFVTGDTELTLPTIEAPHGSGRTDANGHFTIVMSNTVATLGVLRYEVSVRTGEADLPNTTASTAFIVDPADTYPAIQLTSQIAEAGTPFQATLRAISRDGQAVPQATLRAELLRRSWVCPNSSETNCTNPQPKDERVSSQIIQTDSSGTATLSLTPRAGGEHRILVFSDSGTQPTTAATTLWVAASGESNWRQPAPNGTGLIANQRQYQPQQQADLLVTTPFERAIALLTVQSSDELTGTLHTLQPGELLQTETGDTSNTQALLILIPRHSNGLAIGESRFASTSLMVISDTQQLHVTIQPDRPSYAPGATAVLTVTVTDTQGQGVPAHVILGLSATPPATTSLNTTFHGEIPPLLSVLESGVSALLPSQVIATSTSTSPGRAVPGGYWNPAIQLDASGTTTVTVTLPQHQGAFYAQAWATDDAERFAQTQTAMTLEQPINLTLSMPPVVHPNDQLEIIARVSNHSQQSQSIALQLAANGLHGLSTQPATLVVAADEVGEFRWTAQVTPSDLITATLTATLATQQQVITQQTARVQDTPQNGISGATLLTGTFNRIITSTQAISASALTLDVAPAPQILAQLVAHDLTTQQSQSVLDTAALLLIANQSGDTELRAALIDRLILAQRSDGGWGWWASDESQPQVSFFVLEALLTAARDGANVSSTIVERGLTAAKTFVDAPEGSNALRAHLEYLRSLNGEGDEAERAALAINANDVETIAYLLLAEPKIATPLIDRLAALAHTSDQGSYWNAADDFPIGSEGGTGLAALALAKAAPESSLLPAARSFLVNSYRPGGWANSPASARALAALAEITPASSAPTQYQIGFNGQLLIDTSKLPADQVSYRFSILPEQLRATNTLTATLVNGPIYIGYQQGMLPKQVATPATVELLSEYRDPESGEMIDPQQLQVGQLVRLRITIINTQQQPFATLAVPLPAGTILAANNNAPFTALTIAPDRVQFTAQQLEPGVYQQELLLRIVHTGHFIQPAPMVYDLQGFILGQGRAQQFDATP